MRRLASLAALALTSACFADLLVGPEPNVAPTLGISVRVSHGEQLTYSVDAFFRRGSDGEGNPRALLDSFFVVEGSLVEGVPITSTILRYAWDQVAAPAVGGDTIEVRGPIISGLPSSGLTFRLPAPAREDPLLLELVAGDDLQLNIPQLPDTIAGLVPIGGFWQLELREARKDRQVLRLEGRGAYPSPLPVVPSQLFPAAPGDSLTATFLFSSGHRAANAPYSVTVTIGASITWQVRIVAQPSP